MSGRHAIRRDGPRVAPPVPEATADVGLVVPNRERLAYLTHLAEHLPAGLSTSYSYRAHEVVMHVVSVSTIRSRKDEPPPIAGVTVGCRYEAGAWWFVRNGNGSRFAAANNLSEAAGVIVRAIADQLRRRTVPHERADGAGGRSVSAIRTARTAETTPASGRHPLTVKGRVAEIYGVPAFVDRGWMKPRFAALLVQVTIVSLHHWATEGLVSFRQERPKGPIRFLRRELLIVVGMRSEGVPLSDEVIRRQLEGRGVDA
ncbi:hypothetical protein [Actinomadura harenae]|uniref:hypothetical protein n=1 Tax=Actinomadura harenae TaxID=2483351 RepID=UPI0011C360BA|nr:hypothetical protein [Actinomadura harenae]